MDSREFLVGSRRVRRFVPRGSVRGLRVWGGLIRRPEGPASGHLRADCVAFRRGVGQRAVRCLRLAADLPALPARSSAFGTAGGPARRRRENDARFPANASRDVVFTTRSASRKAFCLPQLLPESASAFMAGDGRESAASCNVQPPSRERAAPRVVFHEGGFRRALRPLFADGRRRKIFRQNLPCLRRSPFLPNVRPFFVRSSAPRFRRRLPSLRAAVGKAAFQTVT